MSSRAEEKQRRREERMAQESADKARAARRKRMQIALGGVGGLAVIAAVVLLLSGALSSDSGAADEGDTPEAAANVTLPEPAIGDFEQAAEAAGCELEHPEIEAAQHEERTFTAADYETNPPTSGTHFPQWSEDRVFATGDTPALGQLVHTLEHGRINVQYKPGTPSETVQELEALLAEQNDGYHMLLYENTTEMDAQVAATAWGHSLKCPTMNDEVFDAIRTFRAEYIDKGPESVP